MTIVRRYGVGPEGLTVVICDYCLAEIELDQDTSGQDNARNQGWKAAQTEGGWKDMCPECQRENNPH